MHHLKKSVLLLTISFILFVTVVALRCLQHATAPGRFTGSLTAEVAAHSCKLFVLTPVGRAGEERIELGS